MSQTGTEARQMLTLWEKLVLKDEKQVFCWSRKTLYQSEEKVTLSPKKKRKMADCPHAGIMLDADVPHTLSFLSVDFSILQAYEVPVPKS